MAIATAPFSNTGVKVARIGHGLMMMTLRSPPIDDSTCFEALKAGMDLVDPGEKVLLNSGDFYGVDPPTGNLELLSRFFAKYPEYKQRAFLSVKGAVDITTRTPDSSPGSLRRSITNINALLGGNKCVDLFEPARLDHHHSVEEVVANLKVLVDEGLFSHIGLSEVGANTLRRACKIAPIRSIEIEVSPWTYTNEVKEAIVIAKELGVVVVAYSPLGRGFLTGTVTKEEVKKDYRSHQPRFQEEAMDANQKIVDAISELAKKKGITNAQLCIAWVASLGDHVIPLPGSSKSPRTLENFAAAGIVFTPEEKKGIDEAVASFQVVGARYPEAYQSYLMK